MPRKPPQAPFPVGSRVLATYRVPPFYIDEVLVVTEVEKSGRGKNLTWRTKVRSNRGLEGWINTDYLKTWDLGPAVVGVVAAKPGAMEMDIRAALRDQYEGYEIVTAIQLLRQWGDLIWRGPYGEFYVPGAAPECFHNHTTRAIGHIEPTELCTNCGASRVCTSTEWVR